MDENTKRALALKDLETATKQLRELDIIPEEDFGLPGYARLRPRYGYHKTAENMLGEIANTLSEREISKNADIFKKIISKKNLSPEELKENIGAALRLSLGPELLPEARNNEYYRIGSTGKMRNSDLYPILETIPVDKDRRITIRKSPYGDFVYSAEKLPEDLESLKNLEKTIKDYGRDSYSEGEKFLSRNLTYLDSPVARALTPQELGYLDVSPAGGIHMISSGKRGIAEGVMPRLLLEAASRGQVPHSSNLLPPGQKFTERMARDFQKPEFMDMLKKFLDTGKAGKYWSTAAPLLKTAGKVAGKVGAPLAGLYSNYSEAKEEGLPTSLARIYAGVEELNPTPISGIDFYKGMEKAGEGRKGNIEANYMPEELKVENEALKNYKNSRASKDRSFQRIKNILRSK